MLSEMCNALDTEIGAKFPEKLLQYLIAELNYGGKLTNQDDQMILDETVKTFVSTKVFEQLESNFTAPDHAVNNYFSSIQQEEQYDLTGLVDDPLRTESLLSG